MFAILQELRALSLDDGLAKFNQWKLEHNMNDDVDFGMRNVLVSLSKRGCMCACIHLNCDVHYYILVTYFASSDDHDVFVTHFVQVVIVLNAVQD